MPRIRRKPEYTLHRPTGQARVRVNGRDHYLGVYGSDQSREEYERLIQKWFAGADAASLMLTVDDLAMRYLAHVETYYVKGGEPTSEVHCVRGMLSRVVERYGNVLAKSFGPKALNVVRQSMIDDGLVRKSINRNVGRIRRMFKWAVSEELLPVEPYQALCTLPGLRAGRSAAIESMPVLPVPDAFVDAIELFVSRQVWAMVQVQRLTGARSGEIVRMRGCDLNTTGAVWEFVPERHKTEHHARGRIIFIGPRAQAIVREFLKPDLAAYLFSPADAEAERSEKLRAARKTPVQPSQRNRKLPHTSKAPGQRYTVQSFGRAIAKACQKADAAAHKARPDVPADVVLVPHWHPHQLRHSAATDMRRQFGIESARTVLGHASTITTEVYAMKDLNMAREIMATVG